MRCMPSNGRIYPLLATAVIAAMGLIGCSSATASSVNSINPPALDTPQVEAEEPSATPEPIDEPAPILLPSCDAANPLAASEGAEFFASQGIDISAETGPTDLEVFNRLAGPSAQLAMDEAIQVQACRWPLYIAGNSVTQYSAIVTESTQDALVQSLRDSDFVESQLGQAAVFTYSVEDATNYRMTGPTSIQYVFVEGVWLALFETGKSDYSQSALDVLIIMNPTRSSWN